MQATCDQETPSASHTGRAGFQQDFPILSWWGKKVPVGRMDQPHPCIMLISDLNKGMCAQNMSVS